MAEPEPTSAERARRLLTSATDGIPSDVRADKIARAQAWGTLATAEAIDRLAAVLAPLAELAIEALNE